MPDIYVKSNFPIVTAVTQANPGKVTTASAHGLSNSDKVVFSQVAGMTGLNNTVFTVSVVDSTNFTVGVDTSGYGTFTGPGGFVHANPGSGSYRGPWVANTVFASGDRVISNTVESYRMHQCTTGGTSGSSQPAFSTTTDATTADNTVTWTTRLPSSWSNATLTLTRAFASDSDGDRIFVSDNHQEVYYGPVSYGSAPAAVEIICADDATGSPPSSLATTAIIESSASYVNCPSVVTYSGKGTYIYGITFKGYSGVVATAANDNSYASFDNCKFVIADNSGTPRYIDTAGTAESGSHWKNCQVQFANASGSVRVPSARKFLWSGGGISSSSAALTGLVTSTVGAQSLLEGLNLSSGDPSMILFSNYYGLSDSLARNCRLPASWIGSAVLGLSGEPRASVSLQNCDSELSNYRMMYTNLQGNLVSEITIVRYTGAYNGATPMSWKITTNGTPSSPNSWFNSPEIVKWNEITGSAITVTLETLTDNVTLTDDDLWIEVMYLGTSGYTLGSWNSSYRSLTASASNLATSTAVWTSTGIGTPVKQKTSLTFTPQVAGFIHARVCVGKTNTTVYVDPRLTVE